MSSSACGPQNPLLTPEEQAAQAIKRAQDAGRSAHDAIKQTTNDSIAAMNAISDTITHAIATSVGVKLTIDAALLVVNPLLAGFFAVLSQIRAGVTETLGATTAEILNEFLGTSLDSTAVTPKCTPGDLLTKCEMIGTQVLQRLESEFAPDHVVTPASGEHGAATFAGFGVNFAVQNSIIALIGGCVPEVHLDDIRELGVEVAQNLGLGRLVRQALRPLVQATISTPYTRQLNARYHPNLPAQTEVAKASHAGRVDPGTVSTWFSELGLSPLIVAEVIEQTRERLKAAEWNTIVAIGNAPTDPNAYEDHAAGFDPGWTAARQAALTYLRLKPIVDRQLTEMLKQVEGGFITQTAFADVVQSVGIPKDVQLAWLQCASVFNNAPRKRPSQADMLFLYEAAQINDQDVSDWLSGEGYYQDDQQLMLTFFRLKLVSATQSASAAKAAHLHAEHVAYVTDEITGLWSRPPTKDELNYWVNLLDSAQRTKHDFTTELKALDPAGPAKP